MSFAFPKYVQVKDNYCCCYLGNNSEYIAQLNLLRPQIEKQLPGLNIYISCRDSLMYLAEEKDIPASELEGRKGCLGYIREIAYKNQHPILQLMEESKLAIEPIECSTSHDGLTLVAPEGIYPTKSLTQQELERLINSLANPIVVGSDIHMVLKNIKLRPAGKEKLTYIHEAKMVVGVENEYTFMAPKYGAMATLIESGVGTNLFKKFYPNQRVVRKIN